jgi:hypothetical protein
MTITQHHGLMRTRRTLMFSDVNRGESAGLQQKLESRKAAKPWVRHTKPSAGTYRDLS